MLRSIAAAAGWISREAGFRFLARRRAACAAAIVAMALALGANTAVFSVTRTFLLASIGVPDATRVFLVAPLRDMPGRGAVTFNDAYPNYQMMRSMPHPFAAMTTVLQGVSSWEDHDETRPLQSARVTASFFPTMQVFPALGRAFGEDAEGPSPANVVVISHAVWQSGFAGDSAVIGKTMRIDGALCTVIGVMPAGFGQPAPTDIWMPFDIPPRLRANITGARTLGTYARLGSDKPPALAAAAADAFTAAALKANSVDNKDFRYSAQSMRSFLLNGADKTVLLVQAGAAVLLLLAVLNLASLLVAWGYDRRQEIAVRRALGAGSTRVFRMLILQSVAVVTAGGVLGAGAAWLAMPFLRGLDINPTLTTFTSRIELDATVLFISGAVAVVAGLAAAVLPAWFNRREDLSGMLRENSRSVSLSRAVLRWQQGMVFAQAALSVVILAAAALLGVSLRNITHVEPGFDARGLVVARVQLPDAAYAAHDARAALGRTLLDNLSREPGIGDASFSTTLPVSDVQWGARFLPEMSDGSMGTDQLLLHFRRVSPTYVAQMKIPLVAGRQLTAQDNATSLPVAMISRVLAERLWPGGKAIGKHLYRVNTTPPQPLEIVGIVGDVMDAGFTAPPGDAIYIPFEQLSSTRMSIVVRPRGPASAAIAGIRHALRASDPALAANGIASLETLVQQANTLPRLQSLLLMTFALVAIAIAGIGSYGVMSQLVANREREFAMRLVFGAEPRSLGARVFGQSARLAIPGIVLGIGAVVALGSALKPFVFGVTPYSVFVLGAVGAAMGVVAVASTIPSAVRAMRVEIRNTL